MSQAEGSSSLVFSDCPVCSTREIDEVERVAGYEVVRCTSCGLEFTRNPEWDQRQYEDAYKGVGVASSAVVRPYLGATARLALERRAYVCPPARLTWSEHWVLRKLHASIPAGATVVEVGCGSGRFLTALRKRNYRAVGIEPVKSIVNTLRDQGYDVRQGSLPSFEWNEDAPAAVVMFEVLEHLAHPLPALRFFRTSFPRASIGVSVPSPHRSGLTRGERGPSDYPPNHFLRWSTASLRVALERAGYQRIDVVVPPPTPAEFAPGASSLVPRRVLRRIASRSGDESPPTSAAPTGNEQRGRVVATAALWGLTAFHVAGSAIGAPRAFVARQRGESGVSLAAWGTPSDENDAGRRSHPVA